MRRLTVLCIAMICVLMLIGCTDTVNVPSDNQNNEGNETSSERQETSNNWITFYLFSSFDMAGSIVSAPKGSISSMADGSEQYRITADNRIEYYNISGKIEQAPEGVNRVGAEASKRVTCKLLSFCSDLTQLKNCMLEKGIEDIPDEVTAFSIIGYPITLRLDCKDSVYYISIEQPSDFDGDDKDYSFNVYSADEFASAVQPKPITVTVNDEVLPDCDAKLYSRIAKLPIMDVLKCIDPEAILIESGERVILRVNNTEYDISPSTHKMTLSGDDRNLIKIRPGDVGICEVKNKDLYVDSAAFEDILKIFGATVEIDYALMNARICF